MADSISFAVGLILSTGVLALSLGRRTSRPATRLAALAAALIVLLVTLYVAPQGSAETSVSWAASHLLASTLVGSAAFVCALGLGGRDWWMGWRLTALMLGTPALLFVLAVLVPVRPGGADDGVALLMTTGIEDAFLTVSALYIFLLAVGAVLIMADVFAGAVPLGQRSRILLAGFSVPPLLQLVAISGLAPLSVPAATAVGSTVNMLAVAYALLSPGTLVAGSIPRQQVVDRMVDGWMAMDSSERLVDINPAAERLLGLRRSDVKGRPIRAILPEFPELGDGSPAVQELEMRRGTPAGEGWRYLGVRVSPLRDADGGNLGHLMVWTDKTRQRLAEDARSRARDEMFVLLNAISSAASQLIELEDFLQETIFQVIYPFRSQLAVIFLLEDREDEREEQGFQLASHLGLADESIDSLAHLPADTALVQSLLQQRQPFAVEDLLADARIPPGFHASGCERLLVSPLIASRGEGGKIIGAICLGRLEGESYDAEEVARLSAVAEQIATLIDSSRRSKLAIALSERRNLMRDLHDSVSQKLYALVTMTEAAQASLEAGGSVDLHQILTRMGEHARQAVREMRLFLYQIRPVDIEKEGVIGALHHRLSAVEGRASVKARLLADDDIALPKDKEVALYYIAQEALNNVMRHAYAQSVLVTVKKAKQRVVVEIRDDGRGFDTSNADSGGMGLKNMRERTLQIGGDLEISSKPGNGTRVVITIPVGRSLAAEGRRQAA